MKFLLKEPQNFPVLKDINENQLRNIIGGLIDIVNLPLRNDIVIIADDEGLLKKLAPNFYRNDYIIAGKVIFAGVQGENLIDLNKEQIDYIKEYLKKYEFKGDPNSINYNDYLNIKFSELKF